LYTEIGFCQWMPVKVNYTKKIGKRAFFYFLTMDGNVKKWKKVVKKQKKTLKNTFYRNKPEKKTLRSKKESWKKGKKEVIKKLRPKQPQNPFTL
jgi:hypothetical protein